MPKEILIYGTIHSFSVMEMMKAMADVDPDDGMFLRVNTDGGQPQDGFGIMAKFAEFTGDKTIQVDGRAYSTGLFILCYAKKVNALDVSKFMIHRAGFPSWFEDSSQFTDELKAHLVGINKDLEKAFRAKVDAKKFEEIKGVKIKDLFDIEKPRKDVFFNASEAKKIGLIDKIVKITPTAQVEINTTLASIAAKYTGGEIHNPIVEETNAVDSNNETNSQIINSNKMNKKELLAAHPEICAQIVADGVATEKARVDAWMANSHIDAEAVKAGIDSGKDLSQKDMVEFSHKLQAQIVKGATTNDVDANNDVDLDADNASDAGGEDAPEKTALEMVEAKIDSHLNIK